MDGFEEAKYFCRLLSDRGFPTMLAGGCVRDRLMGRPPKDYDLATTATPAEVAVFFRDQGYKTLPTGIDHGTLTLVTPFQAIEITTLRRDITCHGRHAQVAFTTDFGQDAQRRDFTINALFEDANGRIHDFTGGLTDLRAKRLRFVGDPAARIREDYLRSLRYFRFLARYGWAPENEPLQAIRHHLSGMAVLSSERIRAEMDAILQSPHLGSVWPVMVKTGVPEILFPWYQTTATPLVVNAARGSTNPELPLAWFPLLWFGRAPRTNKALKRELTRLRFSRRHQRTLVRLFRLAATFPGSPASLEAGLDLVEKGDLQPLPAREFFLALARSTGMQVPPTVLQLLTGMTQLPRPTIAKEDILKLPPQERGSAIRRNKIKWYLGKCRDTKQPQVLA